MQAILNCAQASFEHYKLACDVWSLVRTEYQDLLSPDEFERYKELNGEYNDDENRQSEWADLLEKFDPDDKYVSVYKGRYDIDDDSEEKAELTRKRLIAYHQLEAYSLYLEDKPAELAAYRKFLVSVFSMVLACIIIFMIIISHHHSAGALQSRGYCQQGAWAAIDFYGAGEIRVSFGDSSGRNCGSCRSGGGKYSSCRGRWGSGSGG